MGVDTRMPIITRYKATGSDIIIQTLYPDTDVISRRK